MKILISTILIFICSLSANSQSVPDSILQTIDWDTIQLNSFQGKKIMMIVLPVNSGAGNSLMLQNIDSAYQQYKDSITFIGIPSYEDGYTEANSSAIRKWYRDTMHLEFIITAGVYTHNSSGEQQSGIFKWLTDENLNGHFRSGINTYGQKFLLNENGELKGVFDPSTPLTNTLLNIIDGMEIVKIEN